MDNQQYTSTPMQSPADGAQPPQTPVQPSYYGCPVPVRIRPQYATDKRDAIAAVLLALLSVIGVNLAIYGSFQLGYAVGCLALTGVGLWYMGRAGLRPTAYSLICSLLALLGVGVFLWHTDSFIRLCCFWGIAILSVIALVDRAGLARHDSGTLGAVADWCRTAVAQPLGRMTDILPALFRRQQGDKVEKRKCGGALIGILCALPVLLVIVPLLVSADAAFEGLLEKTVLENLGEYVFSLFFGLGLFCWLFSLLYGLRHKLPAAPQLPTQPRKGVSPMAVNSFLLCISAVYGIYLLSQLAYFFSAFSGILPAGFSAAEYARRGFFEMCAVCFINLVLVAGALGLSRKEVGKAPLSTRLAALFILLFSLALAAVSLSKMVLYISSFGMTRLRLLTGVFTLMLSFLLLFVIIRLFAPSFPYMKAAVIAVAILGLATAYGDVDTLISRYNVAAYESGRLQELDTVHLQTLSDGAVTPQLFRLWETTDDPELKIDLTGFFHNRLNAVGTVESRDGRRVFAADPAPDWRHFSVDGYRCRQLLLEHSDSIIRAYESHFGFESQEREPW